MVEQNPSEPINYHENVRDLLRNYELKHLGEQTYLEYFIRKTRQEGFSDYKIRLEDILMIPELFDLFKATPKEFFAILREVLFKELTYDLDVKEMIKHETFKPEYLHVIIEPNNHNDLKLIPEVDEFSRDLSSYIGKYCVFRGRFMNIGLDRENHFNQLEFQCRLCGHTFQVEYNFDVIINRYKRISKCTNCDSRNCLDIIDEEDSFERRLFCIEDLDIQSVGNILTVRVLRNTKYFIKKEKTIDLNEEVELLGILWRDYSDFFSRKETKAFPYFIEVFDMNVKKSKIIDEEIIEKLKEKLKKPIYNEKLIEATHPLTYKINLFYPTKLAGCMAIATGGSWNSRDNIRDTLNTIVCGGGGTYKSGIMRSIEYIIGKKNFYRFEGAKITEAGLVGTTERKADKDRPQIRYGFLALYSNGTICFDEAQELVKGDNNMKVLNTLRCVEDGNNSFIQDAVHFSSTCWESVIIVQNYLTEDGFYNHQANLYDNLGWDPTNADSLLQRFDLFYDVPKPDTFTRARVYSNLDSIKKGQMIDRIADDLELSEYKFPANITTNHDKVNYLLFNYLLRAKELYRSMRIPNEIRDVLGKLYLEAIKLKDYETDSKITLRALNSALKSLRALASLRLGEKVEERDLNYFREKCLRLIIAFRDSKLTRNQTIDVDKIFKTTFEQNILETIRDGKGSVPIEEHIGMIRAYIKTHYYASDSDEKFNEEVENYMPNDTTLKNNWKYRKVLENQEGWLNEKNIEIKTIAREGTFFVPSTELKQKIEDTKAKLRDRKLTRGDLCNFLDVNNLVDFADIDSIARIFDKIKELFAVNNYVALELKSIEQVINFMDPPVSNTLNDKAFQIFEKLDVLKRVGEKVIIPDKWRD